MKPHPRIRKTIKWGGLSASVVFVAMYAASWRWYVLWSSARWTCAAGTGRAYVIHFRDEPREGVIDYLSGRPSAWIWGPLAVPNGGVFWKLWTNAASYGPSFPLWLPAALSLGATGGAWRLDTLARRRACAGLCPKCHYDRTGLAASAVCPECGAAPGV
jgi:hypothetical protein